MKGKTLIIIIIALVAAFLVWKSGLLAKLRGGAVSTTAGDITDADNVGSQNSDTFTHYINLTSMTASEKSKCLSWCKTIEKACKNSQGGWSMSKMQDKADDLGITYNAQIVRSAIWQMHETSKLFGEDYYHQMAKEATGVA